MLTTDYTVDPETGCWGDGFRLAHRWTYTQHRGPIPDALPLDHLCRNHSCVNPSHLEPATSAVNTRRGRRARITEDVARAIRESKEIGRVVAERYGVSIATVRDIRKGRTWRDDHARTTRRATA